MDEKLKAGICGNTDRMLGLSNCGDRAVTRSDNNALCRSNSETCAEDTRCKCCIRDIILLYKRSDCRGDDLVSADFNNDRLGSHVDCRSCRSCFLLRLFFLEDHIGNDKCQTAGDCKNDRVKECVVDGQVTRDTGNTVSGSTDAHKCSHKSACSAADHTCDERLEEAHVNTEDSRLCDTESCGHGRRNRNCLCLIILGSETDCKAGAELCKVRCRSDRHPGIQTLGSKHTGFDNVVHMVQTHDDCTRIKSTHDHRTERVSDQLLCSVENERLKC